jgi:hypothetical protein
MKFICYLLAFGIVQVLHVAIILSVSVNSIYNFIISEKNTYIMHLLKQTPLLVVIASIIGQITTFGTSSHIYHKKIASGYATDMKQFPFVVNILEDGKLIYGETFISNR